MNRIEPLIYVSDLRKSIAFYTHILGFKAGKLYPSEDKPTYAPIFIGKQKLMLCRARKSNKKFHLKSLGGSGVQFFIKVKDVDRVFNKLKDKVEITDKIETKIWGDREFTLKDPDGNLFTLYSPEKK